MGAYYRQTRLPGGLRLASRSMPEAQSVALGIFVDVGSRDEPEHLAGASHALEHMVFKGTESMDVHQLAERLDDLGGNANAYTSREHTCFHMHVLHEAWPEALELLGDMTLHPSLPEDEWQREREVILAEMGMVEDAPEEWVMDRHWEALYAGHALARPVLGSRESLAAMTAADLGAWRASGYTPERMLIAAAGRIEHQALLDQVQRLDCFQSLLQASEAGCSRRQKPDRAHGLQALERAGEQAQIVVSFPGIAVASEERPLAWLANQALGGGMSSRLFREVREKRGLAYAVASHLSPLSDAGSWTITCGTDPQHAAESAAVIADVVEDFCATLAAAEVDRARRQLEVQLRMGMDSVEGQMLYLGGLLDEERLRAPNEWLELLRGLSTEQVRQWAADRFAAEPLWTVAAPEAALVSICDAIRARLGA